MLKKLDSFWYSILWWTINCFYTTTRGALCREASLPPIAFICRHCRRSAALPLVCAPSKFSPATTRIPDSVPTWVQGRSADHLPFLLQGSIKAIHLSSWLRPAVNSAKNLPLDSMCHEISNRITEVHILQLASTNLVSRPLQREPSVTFQALRARPLQVLLADWLAASQPVPPSSLYVACLSPYA